MTPVDVLVAGEIFADLIMSGFTGWPKPGEEAFAAGFRRDVGGAAITACGLAALGTRTCLMAVIGSDQQEWILARLRERGVEIAHVRLEPNEISGVTVAITSPQDRTFFTYLGANRRFAETLLQAARQGLEVERHVHLACAPDWETAPELFRLIRRNGCTLSLDAGWHEDWLRDRRALSVLAEIDLFFPSLPEAALLTGENDPEKILRCFRAAGVRHVALKMGDRGSALLWDGAIYFAKPHHVTPCDPTGAGDAFDAGFLDAWLRGFPVEICLSSANICGALATEGWGGIEALPTRRRLAEELERE